MIGAIVFDVDGVLVRAFAWARILEEKHGISRSRTRPFFSGPFEKCVMGQANLKVELHPFLDQWGWPTTLEDFVDRWFFDLATRIVGIEPDEILFFDDHQANVDAACAAGWRAELYRIGDDIRAQLGDHGIQLPDA